MPQRFAEERLDVGIDYGAVGGPSFDTEVVAFGGGHEHRNARWSNARGSWELGERRVRRSEKDYLVAFFRARRGRLEGFRYRDWSDFAADGESLAPDGSPTVQLTKAYASAGSLELRTIHKPVGSSVTLSRASGSVTIASVDDTTGIVTLAPDVAVDITNIENVFISSSEGSYAEVTTADPHGLVDGETVYIDGLPDLDINQKTHEIRYIDDTTYRLYRQPIEAGAYTSGGTSSRYVQPSESLTWSGEFDVPVRFDTDAFQTRFDAYRESDKQAIFMLTSLPVKEIRP